MPGASRRHCDTGHCSNKVDLRLQKNIRLAIKKQGKARQGFNYFNYLNLILIIRNGDADRIGAYGVF